jgi:hypothetical protein
VDTLLILYPRPLAPSIIYRGILFHIFLPPIPSLILSSPFFSCIKVRKTKITDFEFFVYDTSGKAVSNFGDGLTFSFHGTSISSLEELYEGTTKLTSVGTGQWTSGNLIFNVTDGGDGVFSIFAPRMYW